MFHHFIFQYAHGFEISSPTNVIDQVRRKQQYCIEYFLEICVSFLTTFFVLDGGDPKRLEYIFKGHILQNYFLLVQKEYKPVEIISKRIRLYRF